MAYILDRGLAFNLSRDPHIQDYDSQTDLPVYHNDTPSECGLMFLSWIQFSKLQGQIYEQLYSAEAHRATRDTREVRAEQLASQILHLECASVSS